MRPREANVLAPGEQGIERWEITYSIDGNRDNPNEDSDQDDPTPRHDAIHDGE